MATQEQTKSIVCVRNRANVGKTAIIREFAKLMVDIPGAKSEVLSDNEDWRDSESEDFIIVISLNDKTIGIDSEGDIGENVIEQLTTLVKDYDCDLIVCACRARGTTLNTVCNIADNNDYQVFWTAPYETEDEALHDDLNKLKAQHLVDFVQKMRLI